MLNYYVNGNKRSKNRANTDTPMGEESQGGEMAAVSEFFMAGAPDVDPAIARTIFFDQEINEESSTMLRAQLMAMAGEDRERPIRLMLGSPGGGLYESLAIYDTIRMLPCKVIAVCSGKVMSGGILMLLACHEKVSTANTTFMVHHGHTTITGSVPELQEQVKEISALNDRMLDAIIRNTDITRDQLNAWLVKDHYLDATQAKKLGLITKIIRSLGELDEFDQTNRPDSDSEELSN